MAEGLEVQLDDGGIHLHRAGQRERSFPWTGASWTLDLRDTRVPPPPIGEISGVRIRHGVGKPRITELTPEATAVDRSLLGLPEDAGADPVLGTDPLLRGTLSLHFGPLHVHSASLTDAQARSLIRAAVDHGHEVRRSTGFAVLPHGGSAWCLVTEITSSAAGATAEVVR